MLTCCLLLLSVRLCNGLSSPNTQLCSEDMIWNDIVKDQAGRQGIHISLGLPNANGYVKHTMLQSSSICMSKRWLHEGLSQPVDGLHKVLLIIVHPMERHEHE